jgi:hypothetical protein
MKPELTIVLPHKRNPGNDAALRICLDMLQANTVSDFILLLDAAENEPLYPRVNRLFDIAPTDLCVYWASDMFPSPGWDVAMLEVYEPDVLVTNTVVEPGAIAMYGGNHQKDFGRTPETFDRDAFEIWCADGGHNAGGDPWYAPYLISKAGFWEMGGLNEDSNQEFSASDVALFRQWKETGHRVVRAQNSWVYHLQRYSDPAEQAKR